MKRLLVIVFFVSQTIVYGQFIEQNSGTTENLNEVKFVSINIGYIVGNNGTMLKTTDGGNTWNPLSVGSFENLTSVCFLDNEIGFVSGVGFVLKTNDGGITWETLDLNITSSSEIYFIDNLIGFIGTANKIYKTTDGGDNWAEVELIGVNNFNTIYEIEFITNTTGYAINTKGILETIDGGQVWTQKIDDVHPDYNGANILTSFEIINKNVAHFGSPYYVGLYTTLDGLESLSFKELHIGAIEFPTSEIGFAIDSITPLNIIKTIDGGENWSRIFNEQNGNRLTDMHFVNENKGWIIGWDGTIFHTTNGGDLTSIIDENLEGEQIQIYPNPAKYKLNIKSHIDFNRNIESIELYNNYGVKIYSADDIDNEVTIELPKISTNFCILKISFKTGEIVTKKIVIE